MNHVLHGMAGNPALPAEWVDRLIAVAGEDLAQALAGRADLDPEQARILAARCPSSAVQLVYAGRLAAADVDPETQPDAALALLDQGVGRPAWVHRFAADPIVARREKLAACHDLPPDAVATLAADPDVSVVVELAYWTRTPEVAARLAEHPHAEVRCAVATNRATPPAVLAALLVGGGPVPARRCLVCDREPTPFVHHPNCPRPDCDLPPGAACSGAHESTVEQIQLHALGNPATPAEAAAGLVDHPGILLRSELAGRADLLPAAAERLVEDPTLWVRIVLAANPALADDLCRALAADPDPAVRQALAGNPRVPLDVLSRLAATTRLGPAPLPRIVVASAAEIAELARSANAAVRMFVAGRRDLPAPIRDALAADPDAKVVAAVAAHPGLDEARLRDLVDRHGARVAAAVAANLDASAALLVDLSRRQPPVRKALRAIARHRNATALALLACLAQPKERRIAAGHPAMPPAVLVELLADEDWQVAEAAAGNPALPVGVMVARVGVAVVEAGGVSGPSGAGGGVGEQACWGPGSDGAITHWHHPRR
ncbi:hypothetical protein [Embleya sp. AB8]|uniref:hypothetical protein n=1 Tax=Embleya sp. AB8 TaxID=3156304 RepID=UPI003C7197AE